MNKFFVTGIGTEIGKTVVSAVLTEALEADYWKPVQSGDDEGGDSDRIRSWVSNERSRIIPEAYRFKTPVSPHLAAKIEGQEIQEDAFRLPASDRPLIVEGAGGIMVPLNNRALMLDLMIALNLPVILVVRHYLGSINHTLLSIEMLRNRGLALKGWIVSGPENQESELIIEQFCGLKPLGRVHEMSVVNATAVKEEAKQWKERLQTI